MNSVSEKIDERILRLLGLEDVFDLDYDTYMTLLKEAIVTGANKLPQEELAILANERKRVRGKKGRFKPKKDKITADKVATIKLLKPANKTLALSSAISKPSIQQQDLTGIGKPLESISKTLAALLKFSKKTSEEERRDKETQKRIKREEGLESFKKGISAVSSAAKKMLAPFQNIIDRIWRFIFFTLLGRAFTQLMDWLGDPANKKKIEVLGRFLKDWWPTLLGAAVLFFTPFGKFVRSTLKLVGFFAGRLVKAIPQIAKAVKGLGAFAVANPLVTIGVTGAAATFGAEMRRQGEEKKQVESEAKKRGVKPETVKIELEQAKRSPFAMFGEAMQNIGGFAKGGSIPNLGNGYSGIDGSTGQKVSGFGPDTQMIVAQPGEIVMNKKTVDAVGADTFLGLNRQYGGPGANKPKMGRLYNTGGMVGGFSGGTSQFGEAPLIKAALSSGIKGQELAAFLAQMSHETGGFKWSKELGGGEGMGYSGGSRYHGRGYTQLTHDYNYKHFGEKLGVDLVKDPDLLLKDPNLSAKVAIEYWKERVRPKVKNWNDTFQVSAAINNPSAIEPSQINQYEDRLKKSKYYSKNLPRIIQRYQPKTDARVNRQRLIDKRPWWDKFGWFGGASRQIQKKQGGGEVPQGPFTSLPSVGYVRPQGSFIPKPTLKGLPGPMPGSTLPFGWNPFRGLQGGGPVKENTGMDIPGATADRQLTMLQPGEYVLPVDTVNRLGVSVIDRIVAMTDSNSNAYLKKGTIKRPEITPLRRGQSGMMTLPPITQSASGSSGGGSVSAGSKVPAFSASSPSGGSERSMNAGIYGIVE